MFMKTWVGRWQRVCALIGVLVSLQVVVGPAPALAREPATLTSGDGLKITIDVYRTSSASDAPWIVLAHQAGSSRGEYLTIAPRLNALGFNAVALDQRSGRTFAGVRNQTASRAKKQRKRQNFLAARPDVLAAIQWAREQTSGPVLLWGSSYSAALAIHIGGTESGLVDGVIAMSPGEYIRGRSISGAAAKIQVPVLITSSAKERRSWRKIFARIPGEAKVGFAPKRGGRHGSSALIAERNGSHAAYWTVVEQFLGRWRTN